MTSVFVQNLKRFRLSRNMTQEQAASALGVSVQTVSRWECSTTLPDVTLLPQIARLYGVTIDDLYRDSALAYDNYAQRLRAVFEATGMPEDFLCADLEFRRLIDAGACTPEDLRVYGTLHQQMMLQCRDKAMELFDRAIALGPGADPEAYWRVRRQKLSLLSKLGQADEALRQQKAAVAANEHDENEWICLIAAYQHAGRHQEAEASIEEALARFPDSALLHVLSGDVCSHLQKYSEACQHWENALRLDPDCLDALYAMGFCHEEQGDYAKALTIWNRLTDTLAARGFDAERILPLEHARRCRDCLRT